MSDTLDLDTLRTLVTAVDLIRGLGVLTGMDIVEVPGATGWFDTDYEGKRDAALRTLAAGADATVLKNVRPG